MVFDLKLCKRLLCGAQQRFAKSTGNCRSQKPFTRPYRPICYISEKV